MDLENKNKLVTLKFQGYFAEDKGESPNSHQLKGWFLIRGKEIVSVKEKKKPLGDNRYDNFTPREGRGGTLRLRQGRYHRQLFPSGDTSFLL